MGNHRLMGDREFKSHLRQSHRLRRKAELNEARKLRDLCVAAQDADPESESAAWFAQVILAVAQKTQEIIVENEALGVWDKWYHWQPRWYRNLSIRITVHVPEDDDE